LRAIFWDGQPAGKRQTEFVFFSNHGEAQAAESRKDFVHKLKICQAKRLGA